MYITCRNSLNDLLHPMVQSLKPVSLSELNRLQLMDRADTKYVMHIADLPGILREAAKEYAVLEVQGNRNRRYETIYFDSDDHLLYRMHHNGKAKRYKLRIRKYFDTGQTFFELKSKNPKSRTVKTRVMWQKPHEELNDPIEPFRSFCQPEVDRLHNIHESLKVHFDRITLMHDEKPERITIDTGLVLTRGNHQKHLLNLCIVEVKQPRDSSSPFARLMNQNKIFPMRISKYCLGMILHYQNLKRNNFKPRMLRLQKILKKHNPELTPLIP